MTIVDPASPAPAGAKENSAPPSPVHFYLPSFAGGGAERVFARLANHLAVSGVPTYFVVNNESGPIRSIISDSVNIHSFGVSRAIKAFPMLVRFLSEHKPQLVISALTRTNMTLLLAAMLARSEAKIVISERNQFSTYIQNFGRARRAWLKTMVRLTYPRAAGVTAVTTGVADDIAQVAGLARDRVVVINNPAPEEHEIAAARQAPAPHSWFGGSEPVLVAAGRLVRQKDYATMLRAVALVNKARPVRLIVLGEGPLAQELEDMANELGIGDRVHFAGYRMNRFDYLVRADAFVISSITEGFPNALIEAIACGVKVISTDCAGNGPREILGADYPDALVPVGDAEAMARAIVAQLDSPRDDGVFSRIVGRYSIDAVAHRFLGAAG